MDRPVSQALEFSTLSQPHAGLVQPTIIKFRHHVDRPQFMQFLVSPIIGP